MDNASPDDPLAPLDRDSRLFWIVAQNLYDQIADGKWVVGDRLPSERALGKLLAVSRPTIREALIALETRGYLDIRPGAGAHVVAIPSRRSPPDPDTGVLERLQACLLIEGEAATLAALNIGDGELAELDRVARQLDDADSHASPFEASERKFHLLIAHATGNATLLSIIDNLWQALDRPVAEHRLSSGFGQPGSALSGPGQSAPAQRAGTPGENRHQAVVQALRLRDAPLARDAIRAHLGAILAQFLSLIEEAEVAKVRAAGRSTRQRFALPQT
ncbi:FadR/GntR family transcriptional regulator [Sphingobium sufflavum]|uniref:FadR/GntR family transcriptional regulator n=1 Tax=Sphingobium sufflavum TaxID=1129547 RepID=UPI001F44586C|nr:FadR/GntR family transcriptional regulator [Sphingobium sufflavum]